MRPLLDPRQLSCHRRCLSADLRAAYERGLELLAALRSMAGVDAVEVRRVYREFNADADGICNAELVDAGVPPDARRQYCSMNWSHFLEPSS